MKYLNYLADEKGVDSKDENELYQMARNNIVVQNFKSKGYTIFSLETWSSPTSHMKNVDFYRCTTNNYANSEFSSMLIRTTILNPIHVEMFSGDRRDRILCGFSELAEMADVNDTPKFVLSHIMNPHQPYIFGPNGEPKNPKFLTLTAEFEKKNFEDYIDQLKFVNKKMQEVVEKLTDTDTPPVIIIQSDHGMRGGLEKNTYENNLRFFNNFKAYYFPEKGRNLEFETTTPVNSFRVLFNLYFDEEYELLEDKIFFQPKNKPYQFTDVTDILIKK